MSGPTNPLVTLSVFGSAQSRAALCAAGSSAAVAAGTAAQTPSGCVLPVAETAPPPPVETSVLPEAGPVAPYAAASAAPNLWPLLAGLGVFSAVFFLLDDAILGDEDDNDNVIVVPGSPV